MNGNMSYWEYFKRKAKGAVLIMLGVFMMLSGAFFMMNSNIIVLASLIIGLAMVGYGAYTLNELRFDRESSGYRVYHQEGKY